MFDAEMNDLMTISGFGKKSAISIKIIWPCIDYISSKAVKILYFLMILKKVSEIWKARMSDLTFGVLDIV